MASSQTIAEAVENSLNAYNIIAQKRLESISYDQTIKCKITDNSNRDLGEYWVTDGASTFLAYSEKTDYIKGALVWVTIPGGDYKQQKIISGKYIESDNSEYYTYVSPLDSFIDISSNLIEPGMVNTTGLIANGDREEITLWSIHGRQYKGYDRLAIQANFKAWLKNLDVQAGTYGLRLDIYSRVMGTSQTTNDRKFYSIVLNTNDFYGDPYNFETFYSQVKVVDISMIDCIETMNLVFYQGKDFVVSDNSPLRYPNNSQINLENIWVDSPYISLGYNLDRFTTDTVLLQTLDSATYSSYLSERMKDEVCESLQRSDFRTQEEYIEAQNQIRNDDATINSVLQRLNRKNLQMRWIYFPKPNEKPIVVSDPKSLPEGAIIHWYHYRLEEGLKDSIAGAFWEELPQLKNKFEYRNFDPDITLASEKFKVIIEKPSAEEVARQVYDEEMFIDRETNENYFLEDELQEDETYTEWVNRGLDSIEEQKMEIVCTLGSQRKLEEMEDEVYQEYLNALDEAGLKATQAEANSINELYRKKMLNITAELESQRNKYVDIYNKVGAKMAEVKYFYSDILEFLNEDELPNQMTLQLLKGLKLTVDEDGQHGNYHIYNDEGEILSKKESQKKRVITANWTSIVTGERALDGIERIEWYIPTKNTMIEYPVEGVEYSAYDEYPIGNKIEFDTSRDRQLYIYNQVEDKYLPITQGHVFSKTTTYYVKNTTTYSSPTKDRDYFLIVRAGQSFENHEPGTEEPSSSGQIFRIKEYYTQTATNNTIRCIVYKNNSPFEAEATLTFGPTGTNGTDYTFELEIANKIQALTQGEQNPVSEIQIIPHLYDYNGEDIISQHLNQLKYSWWSPSKPYIEISGTYHKNEETKQEYYVSGESDGSVYLSLPTAVTMQQAQYHILYAELTNAVDVGLVDGSGQTQRVTLTTCKPIAVRSSEKYRSIDGADRVSYNSNGVNPSYYKDPYQIYVYEDKQTIPITDEDGTDLVWEVSLGSDTIGAVVGSVAREFYPVLSVQNALIPPSYYLQDNGKQVAVNCRIGKTGAVIWTQPLYIYQNSYTSALLNSWDGKLTIDEESGIILSTVVGAGAKDDKNRYNGVLMGDLTDVDNTPTFGIYGYHEGNQSFGFKIDGTAFLGKSGKGQINFDGNSGRISSLSYHLNPEKPQGMLIDLDDGFIDMHGADIQGVKYSKDNKLYTIEEVLEYQKQIMTQEIAAYDEAIRPLNEWSDKVQIQRLKNRKTRANNIYQAALQILNEFNRIKFETDYEKLKYLQDRDATYLINDDIFTPQYEPNSSAVRISVTDPYFIITSENGQNLIHIGKDEYYLQTDDYISEADAKEKDPINGYGQGLKINLRGKRKDKDGNIIEDDPDGFIEGYNFKLKGVNNGQIESSKTMKDSYFELNSSGDPFLVVHYKNTDTDKIGILQKKNLLPYIEDFEGKVVTTPKDNVIYKNDNRFNVLEKDLIRISKDDFYLQSWNYIPSKFTVSEISGYPSHSVERAGSGVLLDLTGGKLYGHDFDISAVDSGENDVLEDNASTNEKVSIYKGSYIKLSSDGDPYFRIHYEHSGFEKYPTDSDPEEFVTRNIDIVNISKSAYIIASKDFQKPNGKKVGRGIRLDLEGDHLLSLNSNGSANRGSYIEAYSFGLDAFRPGITEQDITSRIRINSAASGTLDTTATGVNAAGQIQVPTVNHNYLALESHTYSESTIWKIIDERHSKPEAYEELLKVKEGDAGYCPIDLINMDYYDNPLNIGGLFSVSWDGKVTLGWLEAIQGGKIGPFTIREKALYSNSGNLVDGYEFYNSSGTPVKKDRIGVYLGRDGFSVRDRFVIYHYPINKSTSTNLNKNESHSLKIPKNITSSSQTKIEYNYIYDFVTSGSYTNEEKKIYFEDLNGKVYDQIFYTSGKETFALKDLSFYLNGNSVLNGVTAINGNTYVFGAFQVGEPKKMGTTLDETTNTAVLYANTTIYGIFRTTGKTFVGDKEGVWYTDQKDLRNDARVVRNALDETNSNEESALGFIVYRNSYISGYLKVAGSMVVGDSNAETAHQINWTDVNGATSEIRNLGGDFTAYVVHSMFYGDVQVGSGFVAGSLIDNEPVSGQIPNVLETQGDSLKEVAGSGIQAKHIFLGRNGKDNGDAQSTLSIYANTEQWGSFVAGRHGEKIWLFAAGDYQHASQEQQTEAYLKMDDQGIEIRTYGNAGGNGKPFTVITNGGDITLDGTDGNGSTQGGSVYIKGGSGAGKNLHLIADQDYIKFNGFTENGQKGSRLEMSMTGSFKVTVKNNGEDSTFIIDQSGMKIDLKNSLNFSIIAEKGSDKNEFSLSEDGIVITGVGKNFHLKADNNEIQMSKDSIIIKRGEDNSITLDKDGTTIKSTGAKFDLIAGSNKFYMDETQIQITSAQGPTATFNASGITLKANSKASITIGDEIILSAGGASLQTFTEDNGQRSIQVNGNLWVSGEVHAKNIQAGPEGVKMGSWTPTAMSNGFNVGAGGGFIGGWIINDKILKSIEEPSIALDPVKCQVTFNDGICFLDYDDIGDGSGLRLKNTKGSIGILATSLIAIKSTGDASIFLQSGSSSILTVTNSSMLYSGDKVSIGNTTIGVPGVIGTTYISLGASKQIHLTISGSSVSLDSGETDKRAHITSTAGVWIHSASDSYITLDGKVKLGNTITSDGDINISAAGGKSINLQIGDNTRASLSNNDGFQLGSSDYSIPLTINKGNVNIKEGHLTLTKGNATLTDGNLTLTKGNATLTDGNLTLTKGNATLTEGDLKINGSGKAVITNIVKSSTGDLAITSNSGNLVLSRASGSSITINTTTSGISMTGKVEMSSTLKTSGNIYNQGGLYFGENTSSDYYITKDGAGKLYSLTINITKNSKGWTNLSSSLGKLAFADDIKKKFKLNALSDSASVTVKAQSNYSVVGPFSTRQDTYYYDSDYQEYTGNITVTGSEPYSGSVTGYAIYAGDGSIWKSTGLKVLASSFAYNGYQQDSTSISYSGSVKYSQTKTVYFYVKATAPTKLAANADISDSKRTSFTQYFDWELNATTKNDITLEGTTETGDSIINLDDSDFYSSSYSSGLKLTTTPT